MKLERFCVKFLKLGIYASLVAPLIVFPWTIYPYLYGKALFINIISALMLPFYVILLTLRTDLAPRKNILNLTVAAFFIVLILATVFGADSRRSFWGTQERSAGVFFLLHYFLLFFIASSVFRDWQSWKKLLSFSVFISVLVMGSVWWDIAMDKIVRPGAGTRTGGALSNPIFYAAYLLFHIPLAIWLFLEARKKVSKILWAAVAIAETVSLFYTLTRGAMLAFMGMAALGFILLGIYEKKFRRPVLGAATALAVILAILFVFRDSALIRKTPFPRLFSVTSFDITAKTRLLAWQMAVQGFLDRPVLGYGPENYYVIFNKFYNPRLLRFSYAETWSDKPHSIFFEVLSTTGILGTVLYLGLFAVSFWQLLSRWRAKVLSAKLAIPLTALFAGYFAQNLFGIDTVSTYLMFFILLAFASFVISPVSPTSSEPEAVFAPAAALRAQTESPISLISPTPPPSSSRERGRLGGGQPSPISPIGNRRPVLLAGFLSAIISIVSIWQWNIEPAYAGYLTAKATAAGTLGERMDLWSRARQIRTPWSYDAEVEYLKGVTALAQETQTTDYEGILPSLNEGEKAARALVGSHQKNAYYNYLVGRFMSEWGKFEFKYFADAEKYFEKSIKLSPKRQQLFYGLGRMYLLSGRKEQALRVYRELVELDPGVNESHWFYGVALRQVDRGEAAYAEIKEALRLGYNPVNPQEVLVLAEVATKENDLPALRRIYEKAVEIDSKNGDWYARLAALYLELGKKDEARELVIKAVELDPTLKEEATKFLKLLE